MPMAPERGVSCTATVWTSEIKLISINSPYFEYDLSNFTEKNMYSKDKSDGLSKEGSGRVAFYKLTKINLCFTLENNYNMASLTNNLTERTANYELYYPE